MTWHSMHGDEHGMFYTCINKQTTVHANNSLFFFFSFLLLYLNVKGFSERNPSSITLKQYLHPFEIKPLSSNKGITRLLDYLCEELDYLSIQEGLLTTIMPQGRVSYQDFMVDLGHPLVNRVVDGFVKVAGVSLTYHLIYLFRIFYMHNLIFSHD